MENMALRSHVLHQVVADESRHVLGHNRMRQTRYTVDKQATSEPGAQFLLCTAPMRTIDVALSEANTSNGLTSKYGATSSRPR